MKRMNLAAILAFDMRLAAIQDELHTQPQTSAIARKRAGQREEWLARKRLWMKKIPLTKTLKNAMKRARQGRGSPLKVMVRRDQHAIQLMNEGRVVL